MILKQRLENIMAQRREEDRLRKAALSRLDNEDCEEEEEEEEDMTDEEEVGGCLCFVIVFFIVAGVGIETHVCSLLERRRVTGW